MTGARWALMFGNFVIAAGVMVAPGTLTDLTRSLAVSVSVAGQLISVGAATVCFGAPLLAGWVAAFDRRKLLAAALAGYAVGHVACALAPSFEILLPLRALTLLGAAVFTPQAAAAVAQMADAADRSRAIAFIFLGWSLASVIGLPLAAWLGDTYGWQSAFLAVAAVSAAAAVWVWVAMPDGVKPPPLSLASWKIAFTDPVLMAIVAVTFLSGAGQFTTFAYITPFYRDVVAASTLDATLLLVAFGVFGIAGNIALTGFIGRTGPARAVTAMIALIMVSFVLWPLASTPFWLGVVSIPWAFGLFSSNSAQQARLSEAAPTLAPAMLSLNTSAIYLGQAAGAAGGGWLIAHAGYAALSWVGLAWLIAAVATSIWATRR